MSKELFLFYKFDFLPKFKEIGSFCSGFSEREKLASRIWSSMMKVQWNKLINPESFLDTLEKYNYLFLKNIIVNPYSKTDDIDKFIDFFSDNLHRHVIDTAYDSLLIREQRNKTYF